MHKLWMVFAWLGSRVYGLLFRIVCDGLFTLSALKALTRTSALNPDIYLDGMMVPCIIEYTFSELMHGTLKQAKKSMSNPYYWTILRLSKN